MERAQAVLSRLGYLIVWVISAILITLTLFQVHVTLIAIAVNIINNPSLRPVGWTTGSVYGLSRLLWLILGIIWLGWILFSEGYLREGLERNLLKQRTLRLLLIPLGVYAFCIVILQII